MDSSKLMKIQDRDLDTSLAIGDVTMSINERNKKKLLKQRLLWGG